MKDELQPVLDRWVEAPAEPYTQPRLMWWHLHTLTAHRGGSYCQEITRLACTAS